MPTVNRVRWGISPAKNMEVAVQKVKVLLADNTVVCLGRKVALSGSCHDEELERRIPKVRKVMSLRQEPCCRLHSVTDCLTQ